MQKTGAWGGALRRAGERGADRSRSWREAMHYSGTGEQAECHFVHLAGRPTGTRLPTQKKKSSGRQLIFHLGVQRLLTTHLRSFQACRGGKRGHTAGAGRPRPHVWSGSLPYNIPPKSNWVSDGRTRGLCAGGWRISDSSSKTQTHNCGEGGGYLPLFPLLAKRPAFAIVTKHLFSTFTLNFTNRKLSKPH